MGKFWSLAEVFHLYRNLEAIVRFDEPHNNFLHEKLREWEKIYLRSKAYGKVSNKDFKSLDMIDSEIYWGWIQKKKNN